MVYQSLIFNQVPSLSTPQDQLKSDDESQIPFDTKSAMEDFEISATRMLNEVMMPSQLMDQTADSYLSKWASSSLRVPDTIAKSDLFSIYTMVNDMRKEMVKSLSCKPRPSPDTFKNGLIKSPSSCSLATISDSCRSSLSRTPSTVSLRALAQLNISDSDADSVKRSLSRSQSMVSAESLMRSHSMVSCESLSDCPSEGFSSMDCDTYVSPDLVQEFTHHLSGLRRCLAHLTGAAELVKEASKRYHPDECW